MRLYSNKWGTYGSGSGTNELYILPLETVENASLTVIEWSTNEIAVSYPNAGNVTSGTFKAMIGESDRTAVTATRLGTGDIYKLTGVGALQSNPGKVLTLSMTESSTAKQAVFVIPLIVTDEKTEAQLCSYAAGGNGSTLITEGRAIVKNVDIVVRNGGKLTTNTAQGDFGDLYIYPGGKAKITNNFKAKNVYMRGGYSFLSYADKTYNYPDLYLGDITITTAGLKYDLYVDNRYYYMFSMPYDVALEDVTDEAGNEDFPVWVKHYDGNQRVSGAHVSGWNWYGDEDGQDSFFAGRGYEITAKPKESGRQLAIIRFPIVSGNVTTDASNAPEVPIYGYGRAGYSAGTVMANNVGWNFIGSPYLTEYKAVSDTTKMVACGFTPHIEDGRWDGTYDRTESVARFITVPMDTENDYSHVWVGNYTIPAFSTFFFQYADADEGTFTMGGTRTQASVAPRFGNAPKEKPEIHVDVLLSGEGETAEGSAGLFIHDKYEGGLKDFEDVE